MGKVNLKNKVILVTGAAGFIGAALCRRLLEEEEVGSVIGIDNLNDYYDLSLKKYRLEKIQEDAAFTFIKGDIVDRPFLMSVFEQYRPQVVVHLAAQAGIRTSITDPVICIESNIIGFFNILECCRQFPVEHLIYTSSSSVYGNNEKVPFAAEDRTDTPISLYAATKKSDELMAYAYGSLYQIPSTGLRLFTVYGPAGRPDMAYFVFADRLRKGEKIRLFDYGNCERDFTYIDDIVEGMVRVIKKAPDRITGEVENVTGPCAVYNIGSGRPIRMMEFVGLLAEELIHAGVLPGDFNIEAHTEFLTAQPGDMRITFADTASLEQDFGYRPDTTIREGLRRFALWYREYYPVQDT